MSIQQNNKNANKNRNSATTQQGSGTEYHREHAGHVEGYGGKGNISNKTSGQ